MTKSFFLAATASAFLALAALPALAGEGQGDPFANRASGVTTATSARQVADVGSASYPNVQGRPGSALVASDEEVVGLANEAPVQTANSEPRGFTAGTAAFASLPVRGFTLGMAQ